jgi:hypothetical protein
MVSLLSDVVLMLSLVLPVVGFIAPTATPLSSFSAAAGAAGVELRWNMADIVAGHALTGFALWRAESQEGPYAQVTGTVPVRTPVDGSDLLVDGPDCSPRRYVLV